MTSTFVNKLYIRNVLIDYHQQDQGRLLMAASSHVMLMKVSTFEVCSFVDCCSQRSLGESTVE
jgi:hypothetical protein